MIGKDLSLPDCFRRERRKDYDLRINVKGIFKSYECSGAGKYNLQNGE